jgi:hypothetical protein
MKVETQTVLVEGFAINIPVGSLERPTALGEAIFKAHQDPSNWKMPVKGWGTIDRDLALEAAYAFDFYCGGHEIVESKCGPYALYTVSSRGYYHYIGA